MKSIVHKLLLLVCLLVAGTVWGQSIILTGASSNRAVGISAGKIKCYIVPDTFTNYCDGRFTVWNTNQDVVIDNDNGFAWTRDANIGGTMAWSAASNYCIALTFGGFTNGWHLPSMAELSKEGAGDGLLYYNTIPALPAGHPFTNAVVTEGMYYWTTAPGGSPGDYFGVSAYNGAESDTLPDYPYYVWPVR